MANGWTEEELIVSCHVYLNEGRSESEKRKILQTIINRSDGSIGRRIGNITSLDKDGGLKHVSKNLTRIWNQFIDNPEGMKRKAQYIIEQDLARNPSAKGIEEAELMKCPPGEYKEVLTKQRINQDKLRKKLLIVAEGKCYITGINEHSMLIASHIKDWASSTEDEKTDIRNVLCLNTFHDNLFDSYKMTIDKEMNVFYDPRLKESVPEEIYNSMIVPFKKITIPDVGRPLEKYINFHNKKFKEVTGIDISKSRQ